MRGGIIGIAAMMGAFMALTGGVAAAAEGVSLDEIRSMRKEAAHRERRIVFDNDGNEPVYYCAEAAPKALLDK
ncbi:MAG: hypothetical protein GY851_36930, partial [bacterium]|nr:hypothetical protein [bacterium]